MLRQIMLVSACIQAVFGALPSSSENQLVERFDAARRRSEEDVNLEEEEEVNLEDHRGAVWSISVYAGFRFKRCARSLDAWDSATEQSRIRMWAGAIQGIFVNLESNGRRRMGINVDHFLYNVVDRMQNSCDDGPLPMVAECTQRAQLLMQLNLGAALREFLETFADLSDGTDGLMQCALAEIPQICEDFYTEFCISD